MPGCALYEKRKNALFWRNMWKRLILSKIEFLGTTKSKNITNWMIYCHRLSWNVTDTAISDQWAQSIGQGSTFPCTVEQTIAVVRLPNEKRISIARIAVHIYVTPYKICVVLFSIPMTIACHRGTVFQCHCHPRQRSPPGVHYHTAAKRDFPPGS